jgi:hypothetical protein
MSDFGAVGCIRINYPIILYNSDVFRLIYFVFPSFLLSHKYASLWPPLYHGYVNILGVGISSPVKTGFYFK